MFLAREQPPALCSESFCDALDSWVRNLDSLPDHSFKLPLAQGWFYPDFVGLLKDGRVLVVEYKGAHLQENEKKRVGELWQRLSGDKGVFVWALKRDDAGRDVTAQLRACLAQ